MVVTTMGKDNGIKDEILGMRLNKKPPSKWEGTAPDKAQELKA